MVYCKCLSPACIAAEVTGLIGGLHEMNPNISDRYLLGMIGRFFEVTIPLDSLDKVETEGFPDDLVRIETARRRKPLRTVFQSTLG